MVFTTSENSIPAWASTAAMFSMTRSAWAVMSPATRSPVAGSMGIWPAAWSIWMSSAWWVTTAWL